MGDSLLPEKITRETSYVFTAIERDDNSQHLAKKFQERTLAAEAQKASNAQHSATIKNLDSQINILAEKVTNGFEMRQMEFKIDWHKPKQGEKTLTRVDGVGLPTVEKMNDNEWNLFNQPNEVDKDDAINGQSTLDFPGEKKKGGKKNPFKKNPFAKAKSKRNSTDILDAIENQPDGTGSTAASTGTDFVETAKDKLRGTPKKNAAPKKSAAPKKAAPKKSAKDKDAQE